MMLIDTDSKIKEAMKQEMEFYWWIWVKKNEYKMFLFLPGFWEPEILSPKTNLQLDKIPNILSPSLWSMSPNYVQFQSLT